MTKYILPFLILLSVAAYSQVPLNGLLAYYPLNGNASDQSGNGHNGTVVGPVVDTGTCGLAYLFHNNYIDCGNPANNVFDLTGDATICLWVKLKDNDPGNRTYTLFGKDEGGGSLPKWFLVITPDSLGFHMNGPAWGGGYWRYSDAFHFGVDTFYHVVLTKSGNTYQYFINTVPSGTRTFPVNPLNVSTGVHIGRNEQEPVNAVIDEVLFYNRALSQQEINQVYAACAAPPDTAGFYTADTILCPGSCAVFVNTSVNATAYQWSFPGADTTQSNDLVPGSVCYQTAGQYDVQLITTNGFTSDTLLLHNYITVNPVPQGGLISFTPPVICGGTTAQVQDTGYAGNLLWQTSLDGISFYEITGNPPAVFNTGVLQQTLFYRAVATDNCGADTSEAVELLVKPAPEAGVITGTGAVCAGGTIQMADSGSRGALQWQLSLDSISFTSIPGGNTTNTTISNLLETAYYRVEASNDCGVDSSHTFKVIVHPLPDAVVGAADSVLCGGDSAYVCTLPNYSSYRWNDGDTGYCTIATSSGHYWVTITDHNRCSAVSRQQKISIYPAASAKIIQQGDTLTVTEPGTYLWLLNGVAVKDAKGQVFIPHEAGNYSVEFTDTNGCKATSSPVFVAAVNELMQEPALSVYPNPSAGSWQLAVDNSLVGGALEVFDEEGRIVLKDEVRSTKYEITAGSLPAGVYYLRISNDKVSMVRKLVKM